MNMTLTEHQKKGRHNVVWILFMSVVAVIWWASLWGLFEGILTAISGHRKNLLHFFYLILVVLIFFTFYEYPEFLEQF